MVTQELSQGRDDRRPRLWLIGGTGEAVILAQRLIQGGIPCLVTVTTAAAKRAYPEAPGLTVRVGTLATDALADFIQAQAIGAILDASHPFAVEISQGAIAQAATLSLPYWRYERPPSVDVDFGAAEAAAAEPAAPGCSAAPASEVPASKYPGQPLRVPDLAAALTPDILTGQRVLLTLGYRWLAAFRPWQDQATLFARILPSPVALNAALDAGFTSERLMALRPPIGEALEQALWQQWGITTVITKASGQPGGEDTKRRVAERLGVALILIDRPQLAYPVVSSSLEETVARCEDWWQTQKPRATF
ncbi:cobalt-precorrin-6A reductase [Leptolyngbya sp. BL0902]|uniref:precorrin-6A/cobalt-precorrin-6A reductase n=1 Tax=Leptolyngbya sp. BL0902 TaxID=1115757 RepID=UPI001936FFB2|nr:precorrin-6A/cobalt-precorrin-6A reductase [Leptolyngbya sp. BL0902]QQE67094.1 cobalt-precorrin-6A reductase [Leptolyngbya sp. BL0902]